MFRQRRPIIFQIDRVFFAFSFGRKFTSSFFIFLGKRIFSRSPAVQRPCLHRATLKATLVLDRRGLHAPASFFNNVLLVVSLFFYNSFNCIAGSEW